MIANVFYRAGFIESWGRGISKVCQAFIQANLPAPTFENFWNGTLVQIKREPIDIINAPVNAPVKLSNIQKAIIGALKENSLTTYDRLSQILNVDRRTIQRNIAKLKEKGVLERIGEDKNGYWKVIEND